VDCRTGNGIDVDDPVRLTCASMIVADLVTSGVLAMTSGASAGAGGRRASGSMLTRRSGIGTSG
jgi:hypothetical protein